jgi:1-deoxy-D-xylulose 5-phosphate reductoisomerase
MMYGFQPPAPTTLEEILETDRQARELARAWADGYPEHRRDKN